MIKKHSCILKSNNYNKDTLSAMIAVYCIVAAIDRRDAPDTDLCCLLLDRLEILLCALERYITSIQKRVNPDLRQPLALCQLKHAKEMLVMAVYAAG